MAFEACLPIVFFVANSRFHGRYDSDGRKCEALDCSEPGEFRAPGVLPSGFDGPGEWRWLCLRHVREFNQTHDWFAGMTREQILEAQSPASGWKTESPAFDPAAAVDAPPRWADFVDPLDAISARADGIRRRAARAAMASRFGQEELAALDTMGLGEDIDSGQLRRRYSALVRRYHPDRNGGDRQYEARLARVVEAYQLLRKSAAFE